MARAWPAMLEGNNGLHYMYAAGVMTRSVEDLKIWLSPVEGSDNKHWQVPPVIKEHDNERSLNS